MLDSDKHRAQNLFHACYNNYGKWIYSMPKVNAQLLLHAHVDDWFFGTSQLVGADFSVCGTGRFQVS